MAYKNSNEVQTVIKDIPKNDRGDLVRITKIESQGKDTYYDIRNMYTDDSGEVRYTQKGVRLKTEMLCEIIPALMADFDPDSFNTVIEGINGSVTPDDSNDTEE